MRGEREQALCAIVCTFVVKYSRVCGAQRVRRCRRWAVGVVPVVVIVFRSTVRVLIRLCESTLRCSVNIVATTSAKCCVAEGIRQPAGITRLNGLCHKKPSCSPPPLSTLPAPSLSLTNRDRLGFSEILTRGRAFVGVSAEGPWRTTLRQVTYKTL